VCREEATAGLGRKGVQAFHSKKAALFHRNTGGGGGGGGGTDGLGGMGGGDQGATIIAIKRAYGKRFQERRVPDSSFREKKNPSSAIFPEGGLSGRGWDGSSPDVGNAHHQRLSGFRGLHPEGDPLEASFSFGLLAPGGGKRGPGVFF